MILPGAGVPTTSHPDAGKGNLPAGVGRVSLNLGKCGGLAMGTGKYEHIARRAYALWQAEG